MEGVYGGFKFAFNVKMILCNLVGCRVSCSLNKDIMQLIENVIYVLYLRPYFETSATSQFKIMNISHKIWKEKKKKNASTGSRTRN